MSDATFSLEQLIEWHLLTDDAALVNLPIPLSCLNPGLFDCPQSQIAKWISRINDLLHAKQSKFRWAGLCLALATAINSKDLMLEQASKWIQISLSLLSRDETTATQTASIRLLSHIYITAKDLPEFQRHIVSPTILKFSNQLLSFIQKQNTPVPRVLLCNTLANMILHYPSLHRALQTQLIVCCKNALASSDPHDAQFPALIDLYCVMPLLSGKVGGANQWRQMFDDSLKEASTTLSTSRTTFSKSSNSDVSKSQAGSSIFTTSALSRQLHIHISLLCSLLRTRMSRQVQVPVSRTVKLILELLDINGDEKLLDGFDYRLRALESSFIPEQTVLGCKLLETIAISGYRLLTPYIAMICSVIAVQLERAGRQRHVLLHALATTLHQLPPIHDGKVVSRLIRYIITLLSQTLPSTNDQQAASSPRRSRKRKQKGGWNENDELLRSQGKIPYATAEESLALISSLDALRRLLVPAIPSHLRVLVCRLLLNLAFVLPRMAPSRLSPDLELHGKITTRVSSLCSSLVSNSPGLAASTLGLFEASTQLSVAPAEVLQHLELSIHPQLPPHHLAPTVKELNLLLAQEGPEESQTRRGLGLSTTYNPEPSLEEPSTIAQTVAEVHPTTSMVSSVAWTTKEPETTVASSTRLAEPSVVTTSQTNTLGTSQALTPQPLASTPSTPSTFPGTTSSSFGVGFTSTSTNQPSPTVEPLHPSDQPSTAPPKSTFALQSQASAPPPSTESNPRRTFPIAIEENEDEDEEPLPDINMESSSEEEES